MESNLDFKRIIKQAWKRYGDDRKIKNVTDISVKVSTNAVYKIDLDNGNILFAKLSYFGKHEGFANDHQIINVLSNNLGYPFDRFLARSLMKGAKLFIHRYKDLDVDASIVFYLPVNIRRRPPNRLSEADIIKLAKNIALFHKSCDVIRKTLPKSEKTVYDDLRELKQETIDGNIFYRKYENLIVDQSITFYKNSLLIKYQEFHKIPVFIDWNIGNFSVDDRFNLYSRWDYDWFRVDSRIMDFYFLSRVCSDVGDRSVWTYDFSTLLEERFLLFLEHYHKVFPLTPNEVVFIKEAYRFFLLNYVIRGGRRFFHDKYSSQLQNDVLTKHLPNLDSQFNSEVHLKRLKI